MGAPSKHRLSVTLTGGLRAALAAFAREHGLSESEVGALALAHYLNVDALGRPAGKVKR